MSYSLLTVPPDYLSAHGDVIFVAFEDVKAIDPVTYPDYKYVCDIYIGGVQIARLKAFPDPVNSFGIFNIGDVVRSYLATVFNPSSGIRVQQFGEEEFFVSVVCKFGEEYDFVTYPDVVTDSSRKYYNHYNGRLIGQNTILSNYADKAATNRPYLNNIAIDSPSAFIPYLPTSGSAYSVQIKTYDFSNTNVGTQTPSYTPAGAYNLQLLNVSPAAINAAYPSFIDSNIKYYTVKIGSTSIYQFTLECSKFTSYTLHWLNKLGGFESYDFRYVSRKTVNIEKKDFTKLPYIIDSSGNVGYYNSNNVYNEQKSVYSSQYTERLRVTSGFVMDDAYTWLKELAVSPLVFISINGYYVPVAITESSYEEKQVNNDNLTSLILNLDYGDTLNAQYR